MEAVGLLGNLRSPIHAMIAFSETMLSEEFGPLGDGYKSHAKEIRLDAQQILQAVNQAVCAGSSNANGINVESRSLICDLLNHIIGLSKTIRCDLLGPVQEQYRERAKIIHESADALLDEMYFIKALLNEEPGTESAGEEIIDIDQMMRTSLEWIEPYAIRKDVKIEFSPLFGSECIRCNRSALRQMLFYLMRNAVKYNKPGGKIEIKTELSTQGLSLVFSDTRHGILVDAMSLAFARRLTEKHGGELNTIWLTDQQYYVLRLLFPLDRGRGVGFIPANDGVVVQEPTARLSPNSET